MNVDQSVSIAPKANDAAEKPSKSWPLTNLPAFLGQTQVMAPRLFVPSECSPRALPEPSSQRHGRHGTWESLPLSASLLTVFFVDEYSI
jgi:hypothetical protein